MSPTKYPLPGKAVAIHAARPKLASTRRFLRSPSASSASHPKTAPNPSPPSVINPAQWKTEPVLQPKLKNLTVLKVVEHVSEPHQEGGRKNEGRLFMTKAQGARNCGEAASGDEARVHPKSDPIPRSPHPPGRQEACRRSGYEEALSSMHQGPRETKVIAANVHPQGRVIGVGGVGFRAGTGGDRGWLLKKRHRRRQRGTRPIHGAAIPAQSDCRPRMPTGPITASPTRAQSQAKRIGRRPMSGWRPVRATAKGKCVNPTIRQPRSGIGRSAGRPSPHYPGGSASRRERQHQARRPASCSARSRRCRKAQTQRQRKGIQPLPLPAHQPVNTLIEACPRNNALGEERPSGWAARCFSGRRPMPVCRPFVRSDGNSLAAGHRRGVPRVPSPCCQTNGQTWGFWPRANAREATRQAGKNW